MRLTSAVSDALVRFLNRDVTGYQRRIPNNLYNLKKHIRRGDVLLVEGKTRIAQIIKYVTQSCWSHSSIYVGDRVVRDDHPLRDHYQQRFGEEARHLVVEADLVSGVSAAPLSKYTEYNIRVCRPYCVSDDHLERVVDEVASHLGDRYDRRQLFDLGRYLTPFHLLPARWRRKAFFSGESDSRAVICSTLIAQAFHGVRYPILPLLPSSVRQEKEEGHFPWGRRMRRVNPRLVLPRDFDLSPYFRIVKFNTVEEGPIDYQAIEWMEPLSAAAPLPGGRSSSD